MAKNRLIIRNEQKEDQTGLGSGVQTVTGDIVDNTDPLNPIVSLVTTTEEISASSSLTDSGGGATYSISSKQVLIVTMGTSKWLHVNLSGINTTGTPTGSLILSTGGLITSIQDNGIAFCSKFSGSDVTNAFEVYPDFVPSAPFNVTFQKKTSLSNLTIVTFTNGRIRCSIQISQ